MATVFTRFSVFSYAKNIKFATDNREIAFDVGDQPGASFYDEVLVWEDQKLVEEWWFDPGEEKWVLNEEAKSVGDELRR